MSTWIEILNNKKLQYAYETFTELVRYLTYIIDAINGDLSVGSIIDSDTKEKITNYQEILINSQDVQHGFYFYDSTTEIITLQVAYLTTKDRKNYSLINMCQLNLSATNAILDNINTSVSYPGSTYTDLDTLRTILKQQDNCLCRIRSIKTDCEEVEECEIVCEEGDTIISLGGTCKCFTFQGSVTGTGPNRAFVGPNTDLNILFTPTTIIGNINNTELTNFDYATIGQSNETYYDIPINSSILLCFNSVDDISVYKQFDFQTITALPELFKIYIWNNTQLSWELYSTVSEPSLEIEDFTSKKIVDNSLDYIDGNNNIYIILFENQSAITNFTFTTLKNGSLGNRETTEINLMDKTGSLVGGEYFTIYSGNDFTQYYVWFDTNGDGITQDPGPIIGATGVQIDISGLTLPDDNGVANILNAELDSLSDFQSSLFSNTLTIETTEYAETTNTSDNDTNFSIQTVLEGYPRAGEVSQIDTTGSFGNLVGGEFFSFFNSSNLTRCYAWIDLIGDGTTQDPGQVFPPSIGLPLDISGAASDADIANVIYTEIGNIVDFFTFIDGNIVTMCNAGLGATTDTTDGNTGFSFSTTVTGNASNAEQTEIDVTGTFGGLVGGEYFNLYSAEDENRYYLWIDSIGDKTTQDPGPPAAGAIGVPIDVTSTIDDGTLAIAISSAIWGIGCFYSNASGNIITIGTLNTGNTFDIRDAMQGLSIDHVQLCLRCIKDAFLGGGFSSSRNWLFANGQAGGGGTVGMEISLNKPGGNGTIYYTLISKFRRDLFLDLVGGDKISAVKILCYSSATFNLALALDECTYDSENPTAPPTNLYPREGDEIQVIAGVPTLIGKSPIVYGTGSQPQASCPQCIDFIFNPPIDVKECAVEIYVANITTTRVSTTTFGLWQIFVETTSGA